MAVMQISVVPVGTGSTSLSAWVAEAMRVVQASGLPHQLTPMATVVEGELAELLRVAQRVHEALFEQGAQRVVTHIEIDDRRDKPATMESKLASVRAKLG
jgi:uncharacterized protein (TIGR00106 family)